MNQFNGQFVFCKLYFPFSMCFQSIFNMRGVSCIVFAICAFENVDGVEELHCSSLYMLEDMTANCKILAGNKKQLWFGYISVMKNGENIGVDPNPPYPDCS